MADLWPVCVCSPEVTDPTILGKTDFCPGKNDEQRIQAFGYMHLAWNSINWLVDRAMEEGLCTQNPMMTMSYAQWLVEVGQQRGCGGGSAGGVGRPVGGRGLRVVSWYRHPGTGSFAHICLHCSVQVLGECLLLFFYSFINVLFFLFLILFISMFAHMDSSGERSRCRGPQ